MPPRRRTDWPTTPPATWQHSSASPPRSTASSNNRYMGTYPVVGEGLLGAEIERLTSLRDQLLDSANRLNAMRLDGWSGAAAEAFEAARYTLCRELYRTADQHEDAARHLAEYDAVRQRVLALASEIRSEWPGAMPPDAAGHVDWLWGQLAAAAHQAAAGIRAGPPTLDLSTAREHAVLAELRHSPHFMIDLPVRP